MWLGIGGGVVVLVTVVAVAAVVITSQQRSGGGAPGGLDASACPTPAKSAVGPGPWQMIVPRTLCGLPVDTRGQQSGQANLGSAEALLNINDIVFKTGVDEGYETPNGSNATAYRFIIYQGFTGSFNPAQAASVLESGDEETFHPVSPGPHGGIMACAQPYPNSADCVWATSTTLGDIDIEDTSLDLVGAHADANAIRIRDVVEVGTAG